MRSKTFAENPNPDLTNLLHILLTHFALYLIGHDEI
jgi:hypothetical protein